MSSIVISAIHGEVEEVRAALDRGEDVNMVNPKGSGSYGFQHGNHTALMAIASRMCLEEKEKIEGFIKIKDLLLRHPRIAINKADHDGRTALHLACETGFIELVDDLLNFGMQLTCLNHKDSCGRTPIMVVVWNGHENILKMMLRAKNVNLDTKDRQGRSLIEVARERQGSGEGKMGRYCQALGGSIGTGFHTCWQFSY